MTVDDRLDRLEQRITTLEALVRQLVQAGGAAEPPRSARPPAAPAAAAPVAAPRPGRRLAELMNSEEWIGQRGLLGLGVVALIVAAGYLLKLSFDRDWISPPLRCAGGVVAGLVVGGLGWRLLGRYRTYGAALIGSGAAIIYLSVWAASRLYGIMPPSPAIAGLALVSLSLAAIAFALDVEALGATAVVGAFLAPLFLDSADASAELLLLYLACMAAALGWVAARKRWRLTTFLIAASYFLVGGAGGGERADPDATLIYGVAGGGAGLLLALRERWWETRFLSFWGGWSLVGIAAGGLAVSWPILAAALLLAAPVWWHAMRAEEFWPMRMPDAATAASTAALPRGAVGESLYFFSTPFLLAWALYGQSPETFDANRGLLALLIALPYAAVGWLWPRARPEFALVGAGAAGIAAWQQWPGVRAVWMLLGLSLLWAALGRWRGRGDGRLYALATWGAALLHLYEEDSARRLADGASFTDAWALALWAAIAVAVVLAARVWRDEERAPAGSAQVTFVRNALWAAAGALLFFGVTGELRRTFTYDEMGATASLAAGLSISAWWLAFASALVVLGFRRSDRRLRRAGLAVAAVAAAKVTFWDLSSLDALWRVASVFILALVSLSLAYLYHRRARERAEERTA